MSIKRKLVVIAALSAVGLSPVAASAVTCTVYDPNVNGGASVGVAGVERTGTSNKVTVNPDATPSPSVTEPTTSPAPTCSL